MRMYEQYKKSGVEWLNEIPAHWKVAKLKYITELRGRIGWRGLTTDDYVEEGIVLLGVRNISKHGKLVLDKLSRIPQEKYDESPEIKVQIVDVLLAKTGATIGKTCVVEELPEPMTVNAAVNIFRLKPNTFPKYFHFLLQSDFYQKELWSNVSENAQGNLFQRDIKEIFGIIPPIEEQKSIAEYLDLKTKDIERCISKKQLIIEALNEEKAAIVNLSVSQGIDEAATMCPSGIEWIGDIPVHWKLKRLKYIINSISGGGTPSTNNPKFWNGHIPWVSPKDMKVEKEISITQDYVTDEAIQFSPTTLIPRGRVLIVVRSGILKHTLPLAINTVPVTLNQDMKALAPIHLVLPEYLFWLLKGYEHSIITFCSKVGATVDSIEIEDLLNFTVAIPPVEEQKAIVDFIEKKISDIKNTIGHIQMEVQLLIEYKASLIYEVVTGKVRVDTLVEQQLEATV